MPKDTLTIIDDRTNKSYTLPIEHGAIRAMDLRQIKTDPEDFGLLSYDPAFMNTASCKSRVTFLHVAYLLLFGELPGEKESIAWEDEIKHHTMLHETTKEFMGRFRHDAHP